MSASSQTLQFIADAVHADFEPDTETERGSARDGRVELDGRVVAAVFDAAVREKFSSTTDIREIAYFLLDYGLRYPEESAKVPIREGQALIRMHLGEPEMLAYVSKSVAPEATLWMSIWLLRDLGMSYGELATFLDGVAERVGEVDPGKNGKDPRDSEKMPEESGKDPEDIGIALGKNDKAAQRTPATPVGNMLRGLVRRDQEEFFKWRAVVNGDNEQRERFRFALFGVFRELVARRFSTEPDLRVVARFLRVPRVPVSPDRRYPFLEAEALIRSALGERGLVAGIDALGAAETRLQLLVYLTGDLGLDLNEVDDLVAGAEHSVGGQ